MALKEVPLPESEPKPLVMESDTLGKGAFCKVKRAHIDYGGEVGVVPYAVKIYDKAKLSKSA